MGWRRLATAHGERQVGTRKQAVTRRTPDDLDERDDRDCTNASQIRICQVHVDLE